MINCRSHTSPEHVSRFPLRPIASQEPHRDPQPKEEADLDRERIRVLGEAIILQALEDLGIPAARKKSLDFFAGSSFDDCADIAGMSQVDRMRLIALIDGRTLGETERPSSFRTFREADYRG